MTEASLHVVMPARLENLEALVAHVAECARGAGFDPKKISEVEIAAEEALVNVVNYAYQGEAGNVRVGCSLEEGDRFVIEIKDSGIPFDPLSQADPDISSDVLHRKIGGLGIFLIRKLMDDVSYRYDKGENVLTLEIRKGRGPSK